MVTEEELRLVDRCAKDTLAVVRELLALRKEAERGRWLLLRLKAYDMDGPALLLSWPAGVEFNFGAPADSIDAAMSAAPRAVD
jgi:hypothetical protein